jgi:hypothetical protein
MNFVKYDLGQLSGGEVAEVDVRERATCCLWITPTSSATSAGSSSATTAAKR